MTICAREIFGPVRRSFLRDDEEAIAIAQRHGSMACKRMSCPATWARARRVADRMLPVAC